MSLGREYETEYEFENDYPYGLPGEYWYSRNGKIKVCDMTNSHIENCMKIVGNDDPWYSYFEKELNRRNIFLKGSRQKMRLIEKHAALMRLKNIKK